jgi:hypothetical protein
MTWQPISGRPHKPVLSKELADVFEREVLPRLVGPARNCPKRVETRGLHSSTFQLNLSASYGIGGALRGCVARVRGLLEGV